MRRLVVALVMLAVAVGGLLYFRAGRERAARDARRDATLLTFDERAVTAVELTLRTDRYRFERHDDGWWMTDPIRDRADASTLSELLGLTRRSAVVLRIDDPEPPAAYGLSPAVLVVRLEGVDAPALRIGSASADGEGVYGAIEGRGEVLVIQASAGSLLTRPSIEIFREPSLSGMARSAIESIDVRASDAEPVSVRREADGWWIERPVRRPASDAAVTALLDQFDGARILRFVDGAERDDPEFGLGSTATVISLASAGDARTVRIGARNPDGLAYAAREDRPPVLVVADLDPGAIPTTVDALDDGRLTKVNRYKVRRFDYRAGERSIALVREGDTWRAGDDEVPAERVLAFLARVLEAPVEGWTQAAPAAGAPSVEARWILDDGSEGAARAWAGRDAVVAGVPGAVATLSAGLPGIPEL